MEIYSLVKGKDPTLKCSLGKIEGKQEDAVVRVDGTLAHPSCLVYLYGFSQTERDFRIIEEVLTYGETHSLVGLSWLVSDEKVRPLL